MTLGRDGQRLELLVGGVLYSSFHPERPWTGYVWDALAVTGLLVPSQAPRVLLLGCGAGTVLVLLRRLLPHAHLTAIELDGRVLELARERFHLDDIGAEVLEDDGLAFLARSRRKFDVIVDDMFQHDGAGLQRPVDDEEAHLRRVAEHLAPGGVAATNSTTDEDPPGLPRTLRAAYRAVFPKRLLLTPRLGYNVVLAGSTRRLSVAAFRRRAEAADPQDVLGACRVKLRALQ